MATMTATSAKAAGMSKDEKFVIFASSLGTVFEWYDFYLYATLAPFFASLFFPPGNDTAALLSAFATYAAGFLVRPFGAIIFGRIGDLVGRKYTFLVTILITGAALLFARHQQTVYAPTATVVYNPNVANITQTSAKAGASGTWGTNNLDLASVRQLAEALSAYRGALIVASHDMPFLETLGITRWLRQDREEGLSES